MDRWGGDHSASLAVRHALAFLIVEKLTQSSNKAAAERGHPEAKAADRRPPKLRTISIFVPPLVHEKLKWPLY